MSTVMKKLSSKAPGPEKITVLAVSADSNDQQSLDSILGMENCSVRGAASCDEALRLIQEEVPAVVACERELPDGTWKDLLVLMDNLQDRPPMVVMSRHADERLWAEVLNLGGYDLLAKPLERIEVARVLGSAWRYGRQPLSA